MCLKLGGIFALITTQHHSIGNIGFSPLDWEMHHFQTTQQLRRSPTSRIDILVPGWTLLTLPEPGEDRTDLLRQQLCTTAIVSGCLIVWGVGANFNSCLVLTFFPLFSMHFC